MPDGTKTHCVCCERLLNSHNFEIAQAQFLNFVPKPDPNPNLNRNYMCAYSWLFANRLQYLI